MAVSAARDKYVSPSPYWREAATLMLAAGVRTSPRRSNASAKFNTENYSVLMLKRSVKSEFMPSTYVFPGGTVEDSDFSERWIQLYCDVLRKPWEEMTQSIFRGDTKASMMSVERTLALPAQIAFRICAIRETFEEAGVLVATDRMPSGGNTLGHFTDLDKQTKAWRQRVRDDPACFVDLYRQLNQVPDIWSLAEWSNWLTPVMYQVDGPPPKPRRFDTIFYICCLPEIPKASHDQAETVKHKWAVPSRLLTDYADKKLNIAAPQVYELCRAINFKTYDELSQYSHHRQGRGLPRWLPYVVVCSDGYISALPGDALYPENPDDTGRKPMETREETVEEILKTTKLRNCTARGGRVKELFPKCNVQLEHNLVPPLVHADWMKKSNL